MRKIWFMGMGHIEWMQILILSTLITCNMACNAYARGDKGQDPDSYVGRTLRGEHKLVKITDHSSSYFILDGGKVIFTWTGNDNILNTASLSASKIKIKIDNSSITPTAKFRWRANRDRDPDMEVIMDHYVIYTIITCKEGEWKLHFKSDPSSSDQALTDKSPPPPEVKKEPEPKFQSTTIRSYIIGGHDEPAPPKNEDKSLQDNDKWKYIEESFKDTVKRGY